MDDLEQYEAELELELYREYRDVVNLFTYVVETERRFYLANHVEVTPHEGDGRAWVELELSDAWVWDMYRPVRFTQHVRVVTFRDVNIEERRGPAVDQLELPELDEPRPDDSR